MQGYQWYGFKRIKSYFRKEGELWEKVWGAGLLPQVFFISSIKPISSNICLRYIHSIITMYLLKYLCVASAILKLNPFV